MRRSGEKGYSQHDNSTRTFKKIKYLQSAFIVISKYTELLIWKGKKCNKSFVLWILTSTVQHLNCFQKRLPLKTVSSSKASNFY